MPARKSLFSDESFRRLESTLRAGYWVYDLRTKAVDWSPGFYALFGLKPEVVMPDVAVAASLVHPEDRQSWADILSMAKKSRKTERVTRIIRPDGQMIWTQSHFEGHFDRNGSLVSIQGVMIDISEQQVQRDEAERERAFVHSLRKLTQGSAWRAAPNGMLLDVGEWARVTGETDLETNWEALAAVHPDDRSTFRAAWQKGIAQKTAIAFNARIRSREGSYIHYENRAVPIEDDQGQIAEWHGFSLPIINEGSPEAEALTSAQIRAARALLDWSGPELAERAGVSFSTIKRMEKSEDLVKADSVKRVRATLEGAGIRFVAGGGGNVGLCFTAKA